MTASVIKTIGIISMLLAHIGFFFFPQNLALFIIGRIAFPIFAWLISNGALHTRNIYHYAGRLFLFALISQIPFILANQQIDPSYWKLNILFTLFLGLLTIIIFNKVRWLSIKIFLIVLVLVSAEFLRVDYGFPGVLSIFLFYIFFSKKATLIVSQIILFGIISILDIATIASIEGEVIVDHLVRQLPYLLLALFPILNYNGNEGLKLKYLFYIFYPLHYFIIYLFLL